MTQMSNLVGLKKGEGLNASYCGNLIVECLLWLLCTFWTMWVRPIDSPILIYKLYPKLSCVYLFEYRPIKIVRREYILIGLSNYRCWYYIINLHRAARLRGFEEDLNLKVSLFQTMTFRALKQNVIIHRKGQEFNTLLSILYIGYILMQVPS